MKKFRAKVFLLLIVLILLFFAIEFKISDCLMDTINSDIDSKIVFDIIE
jgi:hypothetical protein